MTTRKPPTVAALGWILAAAGLFLPACSQGAAQDAVHTPTASGHPHATLVRDILLGSAGDELAFDLTSFEVPPGVTVRLTFRNNARRMSMFHNWVLVAPGAEAEVAQLGILAGYENHWVPSGPQVLTSTRALTPGEEQTITFVAPGTEGAYPYLCTVPGHAATMRGVLHVKR